MEIEESAEQPEKAELPISTTESESLTEDREWQRENASSPIT
jgi:hypothetical protein